MPTKQSTAVYCRLSKDSEAAADNLAYQEKKCRELAGRKGWEVVAVHADRGLSAAGGVHRPAFAALLSDLSNGRAGAVVAVHGDRLTRTPRELEDLLDVVEAHDVDVAYVDGADVNLSTTDGRAMARVVVAFARKESEDKARRYKAMHERLAVAGRWSGGRRPYGYVQPTDDGGRTVRGTGTLVVVEAEAEVVRWAAGQVLDGRPVYALCRQLNAEGTPTVAGGPWRTPSLKGILTGDAIAGRTTVGAEALWPAIIDVATSDRLRATLNDPGKARVSPARVSVLAGLALCGRCGAKLITQRRESGVRVYVCPSASAGRGGCGRLSIVADPVDALVGAAVALRFAMTPDKVVVPADDTSAVGRAAAEARLDLLADGFAAGEISEREWRRARVGVVAVLDGLPVSAPPVDPWSDVDLSGGWDGLEFDERRGLTGLLVDVVTVAPAARRGPTFDPARVSIGWR